MLPLSFTLTSSNPLTVPTSTSIDLRVCAKLYEETTQNEYEDFGAYYSKQLFEFTVKDEKPR